MPQILVTIGKDGTPRIETAGFTGTACQKATATLQAALGVTTADQPTAEFYQPDLEQAQGQGR